MTKIANCNKENETIDSNTPTISPYEGRDTSTIRRIFSNIISALIIAAIPFVSGISVAAYNASYLQQLQLSSDIYTLPSNMHTFALAAATIPFILIALYGYFAQSYRNSVNKNKQALWYVKFGGFMSCIITLNVIAFFLQYGNRPPNEFFIGFVVLVILCTAIVNLVIYWKIAKAAPKDDTTNDNERYHVTLYLFLLTIILLANLSTNISAKVAEGQTKFNYFTCCEQEYAILAKQKDNPSVCVVVKAQNNEKLVLRPKNYETMCISDKIIRQKHFAR